MKRKKKQQNVCELYKNLKLVEYGNIIIIRKYFNLENFAFLQGKAQESFFFCAYIWKVLSKNMKKILRNFLFSGFTSSLMK